MSSTDPSRSQSRTLCGSRWLWGGNERRPPGTKTRRISTSTNFALWCSYECSWTAWLPPFNWTSPHPPPWVACIAQLIPSSIPTTEIRRVVPSSLSCRKLNGRSAQILFPPPQTCLHLPSIPLKHYRAYGSPPQYRRPARFPVKVQTETYTNIHFLLLNPDQVSRDERSKGRDWDRGVRVVDAGSEVRRTSKGERRRRRIEE